MTDIQSLALILSEVRFEKGVFRGTPAERRQTYRDILERLESTISQGDGLLTEFWSHLEDDRDAWDAQNPFSLIQEEFPKVLQIVTTYRSMSSRARGSLNSITRYWKEVGYEHFSKSKYDLLKYVAQCAPFRSYDWCAINIRTVIKERLHNPGRGISTKDTEQNRDWKMLADWIKKDQLTDAQQTNPYTPNVNSLEALLSKRETRPTVQGEIAIVQEVVEEDDEGGEVESDAVNGVEKQSLRSYPEHEPFYVKREPENAEDAGSNEGDVAENAGLWQRSVNKDSKLGENGMNPYGGLEEHDTNQDGGLGESVIDEERASERGSRRNRQGPQANNRPTKRARRTIECTCADFPEGPSDAWKKEIKKAQNQNYTVEQGILLLSGIAWGGFNACPAHLKMIEEILNFIPQRRIEKVTTNLRRYWKARYNIQDYIDTNAHLFQT